MFVDSHCHIDFPELAARLPELEPKAPVFLPPDQIRATEPPGERLKPRPRANEDVYPRVPADVTRSSRSVIDLDSAPAPTLAPVVQRAEAEFERLIKEDPVFRKADTGRPPAEPEDVSPRVSPLSSSLMTSEDFSEG